MAPCVDCPASLPKLLRAGPKSPAMNYIFNVLGIGHILDTRSSHAMENPSALRLYGDDHGGILTHLLGYRMYVLHGTEAYQVIECMCFTVLELAGL